MNNGQITKAEREDLLRVARLRERVTKSGIVELAAQLLADLEKQLDAGYPFDSDKVWQESYRIAEKPVTEAQAKVHVRCRELGIPDRFAPEIVTYWRDQGEQAIKRRKDELRKIANRQVDSMIKTGKRKVEAWKCKPES